MKKTHLLAAVLAVGGVVGLSAWSFAQPGLAIESNVIRPNPNVHRVTVVNEMGFPIRLKIIGFRYAAHFVANLRPNESVTQAFYGGERLVCAWDAARRLELDAVVNFNQPGTLRLRPVAYAARTQGTTNHAFEAIPRLELQP